MTDQRFNEQEMNESSIFPPEFRGDGMKRPLQGTDLAWIRGNPAYHIRGHAVPSPIGAFLAISPVAGSSNLLPPSLVEQLPLCFVCLANDVIFSFDSLF